MKKALLLSTLIAVIAIGTTWGVREAAAQVPTRYVLTILDRSGSMTAVRTSGETRWVAAKARAKDKIDLFSSVPGQTLVSVWSFANAGYTQHTIGFVSPTAAKSTIDALPGPTGSTPLAITACDAVGSLIAVTPNRFQRILQLNSDGEENSTPTTHSCFGPASVSAVAPYTLGSWHNKVYTASQGVVVHVDLFGNNILSAGAGKREVATKEAPFTAQESISAVTLSVFFQSLASSTGGTYNPVVDSSPAPVAGDLNSDLCVNDGDLNLVLDNYGKTVPPADPRADLNFDRKVDETDYLQVFNYYGNGPRC
jgi:hypothetical protein